jgi:hypothetical protein
MVEIAGVAVAVKWKKWGLRLEVVRDSFWWGFSGALLHRSSVDDSSYISVLFSVCDLFICFTSKMG